MPIVRTAYRVPTFCAVTPDLVNNEFQFDNYLPHNNHIRAPGTGLPLSSWYRTYIWIVYILCMYNSSSVMRSVIVSIWLYHFDHLRFWFWSLMSKRYKVVPVVSTSPTALKPTAHTGDKHIIDDHKHIDDQQMHIPVTMWTLLNGTRYGRKEHKSAKRWPANDDVSRWSLTPKFGKVWLAPFMRISFLQCIRLTKNHSGHNL